MKIKIEKGKPITFFVRIRGPRGVRELRAILDTGSSVCTIPVTDAREIGYEAFYDPIVDKGDGIYTITQTGILDLGPLTLQEVGVAELSAKDVTAVVSNLPRAGGVDVILGLSFLQNFKTTIDFDQGYLKLE